MCCLQSEGTRNKTKIEQNINYYENKHARTTLKKKKKIAYRTSVVSHKNNNNNNMVARAVLPIHTRTHTIIISIPTFLSPTEFPMVPLKFVCATRNVFIIIIITMSRRVFVKDVFLSIVFIKIARLMWNIFFFCFPEWNWEDRIVIICWTVSKVRRARFFNNKKFTIKRRGRTAGCGEFSFSTVRRSRYLFFFFPRNFSSFSDHDSAAKPPRGGVFFDRVKQGV